MELKVGIVGLANVGKSTLFNAILGRQQALTAPYPFATVEPNVGVVEVPDERLVKLKDAMFPKLSLDAGNLKLDFEAGKSKIENQTSNFKPQDQTSSVKRLSSNPQPPLVFATITFVDIAGLVKGAAEGKGLGNQFLSHIRDVDLILHVLRDFDEGIPRAEDSKNPEYDAEIVRMELELKDLEIMEREKKGKKDQKDGTERLAQKPVIYAINVSEDKLASIEETPRLGGESPLFFFCAKVEEEISKMPSSEQKEYLKIYGLKQSCLDRIISECFQALGLISFFTAPASARAATAAKDSAGKPAGQAGKWEIRAWPIKKGSAAPQAAAVIHSDFEKLFIRAEIIEWEKLAEAGSWQQAKEKGWVRTEGRDYLVKDGEVCNFLIGK